jgi:hypothetical protein
MAIAPLSLRSDYWDTFKLEDQDLDFLYNNLLELEMPQTLQELAHALIAERIHKEKETLKNQQTAGGRVYQPKDHYTVGQKLTFPALEWQTGTVDVVRPGVNPEMPDFEVIRVDFDKSTPREFAAGLAEHKLNRPVEINFDDKLLNPHHVYQMYGAVITKALDDHINANPDLVRIAGRWFPRALLVDVNIGHLNLAEAVLDEAGGGPLATKTLLDQIELPTDVNLKLTEFSLNLALQEDQRFDEVGPAGEVLWFLKRLEPEWVRNVPHYLRYNQQAYDRKVLTPDMLALEAMLDDELSQLPFSDGDLDDVVFSLIYPHLKAGTLPLSERMARLFPTAYEAPRIRFTFNDVDTGEKFPGWVVRQNHYIYGLQDWYASAGLIPGSLIHIRRGKIPGEVEIHAEKRRSNREWIRTMLVGADGGIVFAMLKQMVSASFDERMVIAIPDPADLDVFWEQPSRQKAPLEKVILDMLREMAKLNPQGHVHAQELYAVVNAIRRCPPGPMLAILATRPWFVHVGDLHYRLDEAALEGVQV